MTAAEMELWVARSRAGQGLDPKVTDPHAVRVVARLIAGAAPKGGEAR